MVKNVVLVHGFWADSSSYTSVILHLQKMGYEVFAPQLKLNSLEEDVATVINCLNDLNGDCLLVGHSYGGVVITNAGDHEKVKGLLFISAFAPDYNENMGGLLAKFPPTEAGNYFEVKDGLVGLKKDGFRNAFSQDLDTEKSDLLWVVQKKPNVAILETNSEKNAWKVQKNWFVISTNDQTVHPELQFFEAKRMNAEVLELPASHACLISCSTEISEFIISITNVI